MLNLSTIKIVLDCQKPIAGGAYGQVSTVVHSTCTVLAGGPSGLGLVPNSVAVADSLPYPRHCRGRRALIDQLNHHASSPPFA